MLFKESIKRFTPPKGWSWASIGEVAKLSFSSVDKKSVEGENAVRLCNYMDVFYNRRIREGMPFMVSTASDSDIKKFTLNKGDVVLTKDSETPEEIAFAAVIDEQIDNLVCGYHLAVLRPDRTKVAGEYLMSAINFHPNHHQFVRLANGATRFGLGIDSLNNGLLPLPPLAEQRKIAEILRTWDEAIETAEAELKAKQERKRWLMDKLLRPGAARFSKSSASDWTAQRLGDILEIRHGKNQREVETPEGRYPILGTGGIIGRTNAFLYDKPSVLIGRKGTIDRPQYMDTPFWTIDTLFYTSISDRALPRFIFYVFCRINWQQYNAATGVPSLAASTIESIKIQLPPLAEQRKIADILQAVDADMEVINCRIDFLRAQKRGLMQKLLTGEVRVAA
jgi:type I restriction enzyme S subunit